jgi:4-hydroxythreonine-4-phosphate dehydrogenase
VVISARSLVTDFGLTRPRVAVAGLNPHAGEGGLLGPEEGTVMSPAVAAARSELRSSGIQAEVSEPLPGDTVFLQAHQGAWDVVVAAYHDQGLIPVKLLAFREAVNFTAGLPYVRTSPAHGTAADIAWTGRGDASSMRAALDLAVSLAARRKGSETEHKKP